MTATGSILVRSARLLAPSVAMDETGDLLIVDGLVHRVGDTVRDGDIPPGCIVIDGQGLVACPGFIDAHTHLREPGYEDRETIATGVRAAARGGFTTICAMPNTNPAMDNASVVDYVLQKSREVDVVRVLPIGCVTKGREGRELAELWELAQSGVIGFSDDGSPVENAHLMRQALAYAGGLGLPVIQHSEDTTLSQGAPINEGRLSNRLGLRGWPAVAEEVLVARDISLAELTGGRLHVAHLTTAGSVDLVRKAKERGVNVTAEVTPHHLTLDETWTLGHNGGGSLNGSLTSSAYDTYAKVNPPLRTRRDMEALVNALRDGVIDLVATDHAPQTIMDKQVTFDDAAHGFSGLETAFGALMTLVHAGQIGLDVVVQRLTQGPLAVLGDRFAHLANLETRTCWGFELRLAKLLIDIINLEDGAPKEEGTRHTYIYIYI